MQLPKSDCFQAANFGGLIPTESWSFLSEKSYSPRRLICFQHTTEPFAMACNRISRFFCSPEALSRVAYGVEDAIDDVMGLRPHTSRVNGTL